MSEKNIILSVKDLEVKFRVRDRVLTAIRNISFDFEEGKVVAIVGESGSGKSVFTKTFTGMLDINGMISKGSIIFEGEDIAKLKKDAEWEKIRGKKIATIFQDPMTSLNPVRTIGYQISDVTIQAQIIALIKDLAEEYKFTTIYITHDLGVVANVADIVAVMYAGQLVEYGTVEEVFYDSRHPYTWGLLSSLPQLGEKEDELFAIKGTPPSLFNKIKGDAFAPRSNYAMEIDFEEDPPTCQVSETHFAKTWLLDERAPKVEKPELIRNLHEKMVNLTSKGGVYSERD